MGGADLLLLMSLLPTPVGTLGFGGLELGMTHSRLLGRF